MSVDDALKPLFSFDVSDEAPAEISPGLRPGDEVAGWRIMRAIAWGNVASVHEASSANGSSPGRFAIKVFDPRRMDEAGLRRFRLHARLVGTLSHPGLVEVIDWGVDPNGRPYLVMPLIDGLTLDAWIASEDRPDADAIIEAVARAADAVGRAHIDIGIVHRDLKPSNIMVERVEGGSAVRVIDFGVAMVHGEPAGSAESLVTHGGAIIGTPAYMAPEQMHAGKRVIDPRADVYALGVVLFEALTGRRPVDTASLSLVEAARAKERSRPSARRIRRSARAEGFEISASTASLIATALSPEPEDRHPDGVALATDLRRSIRGGSSRHRGPGLLKRLRRFLAREPRLTAAMLVLFATLTAGSTVIAALAISTERARRAERAQTDRLIEMVKTWTQGAFLSAFQAPGAEPALVAVTEAVIGALEEASAIRPDDIDLADHLSLAYAQLAGVVGTPAARGLGDEARARDLYERSLAEARRAAELYKRQRLADAPLAMLSVANAMRRLVMLTTDATERCALMTEAQQIADQCLAAMPDREEVLIGHAGIIAAFAEECASGEAQAASLERAASVLMRVPQDSAMQPGVRRQLMVVHLNAAAAVATLNTHRARVHLAAADELVADRWANQPPDPGSPQHAMLTRLSARARMIDATIASAEGSWDAALSLSQACVEQTRHLAASDPASALSALDHATRLRQRAELLLRFADRSELSPNERTAARSEAATLASEGIAHAENVAPERPRMRHERIEIDLLRRVLETATR